MHTSAFPPADHMSPCESASCCWEWKVSLIERHKTQDTRHRRWVKKLRTRGTTTTNDQLTCPPPPPGTYWFHTETLSLKSLLVLRAPASASAHLLLHSCKSFAPLLLDLIRATSQPIECRGVVLTNCPAPHCSRVSFTFISGSSHPLYLHSAYSPTTWACSFVITTPGIYWLDLFALKPGGEIREQTYHV